MFELEKKCSFFFILLLLLVGVGMQCVYESMQREAGSTVLTNKIDFEVYSVFSLKKRKCLLLF